MKIVKKAIINMPLSLLQMQVSLLTDNNVIYIDQVQTNKIIQNVHTLLNNDLIKLKKQKLLFNNQIILDVITDIKPIQITSSCDCDLNVIELKSIQDLLIQNNYQIKIIL